MSKIRIPVFYRLFLTYIICSIIPLLIIAGLMYGASRNFFTRKLKEQIISNLDTFHESIDERIKAYEEIIASIGKDNRVNSALTQKENFVNYDNDMYEIIYQALIEEKIKPIVHVTDLVGEQVYSTGVYPQIHLAGIRNNWGIFRELNMNEEKFVLYLQEIDYGTYGKTIMTIGSKIYEEDGKHIGYVMVDVPREVVNEQTRTIYSGLSMQMVLVDDYGYTLLDTLNKNMEGKFQQASYLDLKKIDEHKPINEMIMKDSFLIFEYKDTRLGTTTKINVSSEFFSAFNRIMSWILIIGSGVSLLISGLLALIQARSISRPINELIEVMGQVEKGILDVRADVKSRDEIGDLGKYFNQMLNRLNIYMERIIEKQKQLRTTEIKMLQAQIKPHFIYNTLDVIKWSVKLGNQENAVSVVTNLARLLRLSIDSSEEFETIRNNIEFINSYLAIQKIKYDNSFEVIIDIDERLMECKIPRLILQPFIENAIVHGFGKSNKSDGVIRIIGRFTKYNQDENYYDSKNIEFHVIDNGVGMTEQEIEELPFEYSESHIGIYNVNKRIQMYFGEEYGVKINSSKGKGTEVIILMKYA